MRLKIRGLEWGLIYAALDAIPPDSDGDKCAGLCDYENRTLWIDGNIRGRKRMEVEIHEIAHAVLPKLKHKHVARLANQLARALVEIGYRHDG